MKIRYLDGVRLLRGVRAGAERLCNSQAELDRINVFPVPDGDTGANLVGTFGGLRNLPHPAGVSRIGPTAELIAESVLTDARGNSGAIMAEFVCRLCEEWQRHDRIDTRQFASALVAAAAGAKTAVARPREGTLLTVLDRWARWVAERSKVESDFKPLILDSLGPARRFLEETTDQLDVLEEAGVVDAGALGFVCFLEGICELIQDGRLSEFVSMPSQGLMASQHAHPIENASEYRYCTECMVIGNDLSRDDLRNAMTDLGDSLIVTGVGTRARIHIHANDPGIVFRSAAQFGDVCQAKADDMFRQQASVHRKDRIAIVTDSACDLPAEIFDQLNIHIVPMRLRIGSEDHIARLTLSDAEFYRLLDLKSGEPPKTSQPTPADFRRLYQFVTQYHDNVISLHLADRVSGTLQLAKRVAENVSEKIHVIDSRSASIGLGFLVQQAAQWAEQLMSVNEVIQRLETAVEQTRSMFCVERLDHLIRGGRVSRAKGMVGKLLGMKPIFQYDETGMPQLAGKALRGQSVHDALLQKVQSLAREMPTVRVGIAHADDLARAQWYAEQLESTVHPASTLITELSPVIAIHGGRGTIGITMMPDDLTNT